MNFGREKGNAKDGIVNGVFNPPILRNTKYGTVRYFLTGYVPETKTLTVLNTTVNQVTLWATYNE